MVFRAHRLVKRPGKNQILTVGAMPGGQSQSLAGIFLVMRMTSIVARDIHRDCHARVGHGERLELRFPDECGTLISSEGKMRDLDVEKRKVTFSPLVPPIGDQAWKEDSARQRLGARIGFTLIPNDTLDGIRNQRRDHPVKKIGRAKGTAIGQGGGLGIGREHRAVRRLVGRRRLTRGGGALRGSLPGFAGTLGD